MNGAFCFPPRFSTDNFPPQTMGDEEVNAPNITTHTTRKFHNWSVSIFVPNGAVLPHSYTLPPACFFFVFTLWYSRFCSVPSYRRGVYQLLNDLFGSNPVVWGLCWITDHFHLCNFYETTVFPVAL